ncbi:8-oxo-dGTP diphosphatase [Nocardioides luteus]|uniref:Hydrolase MutT/NUDIX n=1 Tax=Nocardioides luteus TaxID=1844 RepID=A0ABQ5SXN4_9ACTN|nr:NUDIX domain-containing protein [Nocardioides luteus]MDR7312324.1 8-oxo-dGTP diphosphatase [Nocardioides luteus]GGR57713.1 putative hydrolase MutT/NUDIX [Nocardioides luteus]GLJ68569.1 putative hydrolase MutT/NUDIX [Nocardioides luteus]
MPEIPAAGVVVFREHGGRAEVALVHRPKYDDWSFPKGKVDPGESLPVTAIREALEETGLRVALGRPLRPQRYPVEAGTKVVHYWVARTAAGTSDVVDDYPANDEIDRVEWLSVKKARKRLSYLHDRETLQQAEDVRHPSTPLIVLRHAVAVRRSAWEGEDAARPLDDSGRTQAVTLAGLLTAYDVRRVITSSSTRCVQSVAPYAGLAEIVPEQTSLLSEEGADRESASALAAKVLGDLTVPTVICTHRPVLPWLFEGLGVRDPKLAKGGLAVLHVAASEIRAVEELEA